MATRRVLLRVKEEIGCPIFHAGDQMVLHLPRIDRTASTEVCALAVTKFVNERGEWNCEDMHAPIRQNLFLCPRAQNPVIFEIHEFEEQHDSIPMMGSITGDAAEAVTTLRSVPIFRQLPAQVLARLARQIRIETYEPGAVVLEKGAPGRAFYVVYRGELEVIDYADQEVSSVVTCLRSKDCFGEMSLLTGAPCAATVVARTDVTLFALDKADFELMLRETSYMASAFTRLLASRLMSTNVLLVKEGSKALSGKLQEMGLATVLQVLGDSNRSGTLVVDDYAGRKGTIGFSNGRIFEASLEEAHGEEAIYAMLAWTKGDFWFDKKVVPATDKIDCSVMGILLEGMRRSDEASRGADANASAELGAVPAPESIEFSEL